MREEAPAALDQVLGGKHSREGLRRRVGAEFSGRGLPSNLSG